MKTSPLLILALPCAVATTVARADDPVPNPPVPVSVGSVFAPDGFDDNDEAQVVLDGYLPSTCYRVSHTTSHLDPASGEINVVQYARRFGGVCLPVKVPFFSEVRLGVLPAAKFGIKSRGAAAETLAVKEASSGGPDDYLYAPVDTVRVDYDHATHDYVATINGRLTSSCLQWDGIRVLDQGKVVVLMPILKAADGAACVATETAFEEKAVLPKALKDGRHLLHVRSLNGKAVNALFTVKPQTDGE